MKEKLYLQSGIHEAQVARVLQATWHQTNCLSCIALPYASLQNHAETVALYCLDFLAMAAPFDIKLHITVVTKLCSPLRAPHMW